MCESSWASTPSTSRGSSRRQRPVVTATAACFGLRPVANAFGTSVSITAIRRLRQVGQRAQALDHVVQLGRLVALDDLGPGRGERELVGGEVLDEREADDDHDHHQQAGVQHLEEDDREDDVEQAEQPVVSTIRAVSPASRPYALRFIAQLSLLQNVRQW